MSLRRLRPGTAAAGLAALTVALGACGSPADTASAPPAAGTGSTVNVVASTNVYAAIAQAVGGDKVTVSSIIDDPSADPHSHEATPAEAATVAGAQLVVLNGGGYDDFMTGLVSSAGGNRTVIDAVEVSGLEAATEAEPAGDGHSDTSADAHDEHGDEHGDEHADAHAGHDHGSFNEHVWYSLPAVKKLAAQIALDLRAADAANAAEYSANADAFAARIDGLQAKVDAIKAAHPGARVAVTEPVPGYLLADAGLTNATPEEFARAIETDTDPPAAVLQQTLALFTADPVRVLVLNGQTQTPTTDQVKQAATAAGVPVVEVTETLPAGVTDYVTWMGGQMDALATALDRT
ncbi:metal ABC transporter solute-binding protein, Zn/Mn family [Pseudonocardia sp. H11422]|uniref:metal ABC transporter solute-binding protein, Zn/Mn family n=1 Tax=Pseudonocardia sp. H11422 TaxID=2835866 RepID=UPI001BDBF2CA|nr:zinc ABC transporter substrate-binding protein [Pseudonocardia sp. H11422]